MKVLAATCGSKHSDDAVRWGNAIARLTNGPLTILTVIKEPDRRPDAEAILERSRSLAECAADITCRVRLGHPAEAIVAEAREGSYDLITVGTWPKGRLLGGLLAPTTERIVMQAPCPALIARDRSPSLRHALLCVSGISNPTGPAHFLARLAAQSAETMTVTLLHVMSQMSAAPGTREGWQLEASAAQLMAKGTPEGLILARELDVLAGCPAIITPTIRHGLVVDEVLMEAMEGDCDLLVIGAHRQAGWERYLLDDLSHQIAVRSDRPVVIV